MSQPATIRRPVGRPAKPVRPLADYTPADALPTPTPATTELTVVVYHRHQCAGCLRRFECRFPWGMSAMKCHLCWGDC